MNSSVREGEARSQAELMVGFVKGPGGGGSCKAHMGGC